MQQLHSQHMHAHLIRELPCIHGLTSVTTTSPTPPYHHQLHANTHTSPHPHPPQDHLSPHGDPVLHATPNGAQAGPGLLGTAGHVLSDVAHAVAGAGGPSGGTGEESLSEVVAHEKPVEDSEALRAGQVHHEQPLMRGPGA